MGEGVREVGGGASRGKEGEGTGGRNKEGEEGEKVEKGEGEVKEGLGKRKWGEKELGEWKNEEGVGRTGGGGGRREKKGKEGGSRRGGRRREREEEKAPSSAPAVQLRNPPGLRLAGSE